MVGWMKIRIYPSMTLMPHSSARFFALIPCAGSGSRAGTSRPKQYQEIAGLPMVLHTLRAFAAVSRLTRGVLVVAPDDSHMEEVMAADPQPLFTVAHVGGASRAASVMAGLRELSALGAQETDWVLVHDAARCLVTPEQINALIDACQGDAVGGLLAHPVADTLKQEFGGRVSGTIARDSKWLAQTPQMFRKGALWDALTHAGHDVTDESSAMEAAGFAPRLVAASAQNFKVTYPEDFALAHAVLMLRSEKR
jgi:2-C-methyl-D-erythritol 4-phosphate cytidylyltransferase